MFVEKFNLLKMLHNIDKCFTLETYTALSLTNLVKAITKLQFKKESYIALLKYFETGLKLTNEEFLWSPYFDHTSLTT